VRSLEQLLQDPHLRARGFWREVERAHVGRYVSSTTVFRRDGQALPLRHVAPTLGEHTQEVLQRLLQLDARQLQALEGQGVIGTQARPKARGAGA
jgi:crotonobetainyl-CoA:carnitine CoA-transferase CaiB-like acyl-CoA transferase